MPLYLDDFISILAEICKESNLRVAVSESLKGGVTTGVSAIVGGLLLGPLGLAIGGALGGGLSAISARQKFKSVAVILLEMTPQQKQKLYEKVHYAFRDFSPADVVTLSALIVSQTAFKETALQVVKNFLRNEMSFQLL